MSSNKGSNDLVRACAHALKHNLNVRSNETVLIVTDANKGAIADAFEHAVRHLTPDIERIEIAIAEFNGQEPGERVAQKMKQADVVLMPTTKSLSWTRARKAATDNGARVASMTRITEEIILRTFPVDYHAIRERANRICDLLDAASQVAVKTEAGTDLTFSIAGHIGHGRKGGIYTQPGHWGNLPCGEAFIAPIEGTANGVYVVDASQAGVGRLEAPIRITVENGMAVNFEGGEQAQALADMLQAVGDPKAYNIAEFGIGCNDQARICGITLEDEKVLGTCHIALGNNAHFDGKVEVGVHVDGVITYPTVLFDDKEILESGTLLLE